MNSPINVGAIHVTLASDEVDDIKTFVGGPGGTATINVYNVG